jgi:hypothetical protein
LRPGASRRGLLIIGFAPAPKGGAKTSLLQPKMCSAELIWAGSYWFDPSSLFADPNNDDSCFISDARSIKAMLSASRAWDVGK